MTTQTGLEWVQTTFNLEPRWTVDPTISDIESEIQNTLKPIERCKATFMTQGAFNKLFKIEYGTATLITRVSLPVDPHHKTASEVATLRFILENGKIPVPTVIAFKDTSDNPIGFEWMLMEFMSGSSLYDKWRFISWSAKEAIVQQLAAHCASMYGKQFEAIGNIYPNSESENSVSIGRIVSMHFFWGNRINQKVSRGPFSSSRDWIAARLCLNENDALKVLRENEDEDERDDAERTLVLVNRLRTHLPEFFPTAHQEQTMIFHDDLGRHNILVDDAGKLTAIVDWECVSALPLWKACQYPAFLNGRDQTEEPHQKDYLKNANDEPDELFWEVLLEYELTRLRSYFLQQMLQLEPDWVEVFSSSQRQRDFDVAAQYCDDEFTFRHITAWLDDLESGEELVRSLKDRIWG